MMGFFIGTIDNKQHINLSNYAWIQIEDDMHNFYSEGVSHNLSGFLNNLFFQFYENAKASITYRKAEIKTVYEQIMSDSDFIHFTKSQKDLFVASMVKSKLGYLIKENKKYPKGEGRKFRLNNQNCDILSDSSDDIYYDGSIGQYLKSIFEEYATKPLFERELVFYSNFISTIHQAIHSHSEIKINLTSGKSFYVKPYNVVTDKIASFNYLVGYALDVKSGDIDIYKLSTFRLSRIKEMRAIKSRSGKLKVDEINKLEDILSKKGPQFLSGEEHSFIVRLTKEGIKKYNSQINMRPLYNKIDEHGDYHFTCTESQIMYYFYKFGRDAVVLEPKYVHERMLRNYKSAVSAYEKIYAESLL